MPAGATKEAARSIGMVRDHPKLLIPKQLAAEAQRLELLDADQVKTLLIEFSDEDIDAFRKSAVGRGWLTSYQLDELEHGRGQNLVLGQYSLLEPLGQGGMGQV